MEPGAPQKVTTKARVFVGTSLEAVFSQHANEIPVHSTQLGVSTRASTKRRLDARSTKMFDLDEEVNVLFESERGEKLSLSATASAVTRILRSHDDFEHGVNAVTFEEIEHERELASLKLELARMAAELETTKGKVTELKSQEAVLGIMSLATHRRAVMPLFECQGMLDAARRYAWVVHVPANTTTREGEARARCVVSRDAEARACAALVGRNQMPARVVPRPWLWRTLLRMRLTLPLQCRTKIIRR